MNPFGGGAPSAFAGFGQSSQRPASPPNAGVGSLFEQPAAAPPSNGFSFGTAPQGVQWGAQARPQSTSPTPAASPNGAPSPDTTTGTSGGRVSVLKRLGLPGGDGQQRGLQRQGSQRTGRALLNAAIEAKRGRGLGRSALRRALPANAQQDPTSPGSPKAIAARARLPSKLVKRGGMASSGGRAATQQGSPAAAAIAGGSNASPDKERTVAALQKLVGSAAGGRTSPVRARLADGAGMGAGASPGRPAGGRQSQRGSTSQFAVLNDDVSGDEEEELDEATLAAEKAAALAKMPAFGASASGTAARPASPGFGAAQGATGAAGGAAPAFGSGAPAQGAIGAAAGAAAGGAPAFGFGGAAQPAAAAQAVPFGFGAPATQPAAAPVSFVAAAQAAAAPASTPAFCFGAAATTAPAAAPTPAFGFGAAAQTAGAAGAASAPAFGFAAATAAQGAASFAPAAASAGGSASLAAQLFGGAAPAAPAQPSVFAGGGPASGTGAAPSSSPFGSSSVFGSTSPAFGSSSSPFGSSSSSSSPAFASSSAAPAFGRFASTSTFGSTSVFGSTSAATAPSTSAGAAFGSSFVAGGSGFGGSAGAGPAAAGTGGFGANNGGATVFGGGRSLAAGAPPAAAPAFGGGAGAGGSNAFGGASTSSAFGGAGLGGPPGAGTSGTSVTGVTMAPVSGTGGGAGGGTGVAGDDGDEIPGLDPKCEDMCPVLEREDRAASGQLHPLEWAEADNRYSTSAALAVKKYTRSEAGDKPNPALIRTWAALDKTLAHLRTLMDTPSLPLIKRQPFLWDRYRGVRKDMSQQGLARKGLQQLAWCIAANEEIARFHIAVDEELANEDKANVRPEDVKRPKAKAIQFDPNAAEGAMDDGMDDADDAGAAAEGGTLDEKYDGHLNHQELTKALLDLSDLYSLAQHLGVPTPNISEFTAYYLVFMAGQHGGFYKKVSDIVKTLNTCTEDMLRSPYVQFAIRLMEVLRQGNWRGYFKLLRGAPYLMAAAAQVYLPNMRSTALEALVFSGPSVPGHPNIRHHALLSHFASELLFDNLRDAMHFAVIHGLTVQRLPGGADAVVYEDKGLEQRFKRPKPLLRQRLGFITQKRGAQLLRDISTTPCPLPTIDATSAGATAASYQVPAAAAQLPPQQGQPEAQLLPYSPAASPVPTPEATSAATPEFQAPGAMFAPPVPSPIGSSGKPPSGRPGSAGAKGKGMFGLGMQQPAQQQLLQLQLLQQQQQQQQQSVQQQQPLAQQPFAFGAQSTQAQPVMSFQQQQQQQVPSTSGLWAAESTKQQQQQQQQQNAATADAHRAAQSRALAAEQQRQQQEQQRQQQAALQAALEQQRTQQQQQQQQAMLAQQAQLERLRQQQHMERQQQLQRQQQEEQERQRQAELQHKAVQEAEAARQKEREAEEQRRRQEEQRFQEKCAQAVHWLWLSRWIHVTRRRKQARLKRARDEELLSSCNSAMGLLPRSLHQQAGGARLPSDYSLTLEHQEKRRRLNASWQSQLADDTPLDLPRTIWPSLAASQAQQQQSQQHNQQQQQQQQLQQQQQQQGGQHLYWRLAVCSGWGETGQLRPPAFQTPAAQWLRAKLCCGHNIEPQDWGVQGQGAGAMTPVLQSLAIAGAAGASSVAAGNGVVAGKATADGKEAAAAAAGGAAGPSKTAGQHGLVLAPAATLAAAAVGAAAAGGRLNGSLQATGCSSGRTVWRAAAYDVLTLQQVQLAGRDTKLSIQVDDICASKLQQSEAPAASNDGAASAAVQGTSGVLLLVSGPDGAEVASGLGRLRVLLEHMAEGVAVPLAVLSCSDPSTVPALQQALNTALQQMPDVLRAKLSTGAVLAMAPGADISNGTTGALSSSNTNAAESSAQDALQAALAFLAGVSPPQPQLQPHPLRTLLQRQVGRALQQLAATAAGPGAYVQACNTCLHELDRTVADSAQGSAARWGFPPPQLSSAGICRAPAVVQRQRAVMGGLQLPEWQSGPAGQGCSQASLLELSAYLTNSISPIALPEAATVAAALPRTANQQPTAAATVAAAFQQLFVSLLERLDGAGFVLLSERLDSAFASVAQQWPPLLPPALSSSCYQQQQPQHLALRLPAKSKQQMQGDASTLVDGPIAWGTGAGAGMSRDMQPQQQQHQQQEQQREPNSNELAKAGSRSMASSVRQAAANVLREAREIAARFNVRLA